MCHHLPHRQATRIINIAAIPENSAAVVVGLARSYYDDATDIARTINLIYDIDDIATFSDLSIDFELAMILNNYDNLMSKSVIQDLLT